jgi:CRP-like cAMP-binding protein
MTDNLAPASAAESTMARLASDPALGSRRHSAPAGTILHECGAPADNLYLINYGEVRLYQLSPDGSRRLLDILGPGEWFGAEAVGRLVHYGCQARAITDTTFCVVPARRLLAALPAHPQASLEIISQLAGRLSMATEDASRLAFDDCRRRLVKTLLKFSHSAAASASGENVVLRITHEQLAQAVGAARETISLALSQLRHASLLRTGRNKLIFNPQVLDAILNGD